MKKVSIALPLVILAFIPGPTIESSLRQSLVMSVGGIFISISRPVSVGLLTAAMLLVALSVFASLRRCAKR